MTACLCPMCVSVPAPTYSNAYRHECLDRSMANDELQMVMRQATVEGRRSVIAKFGAKHGESARRELERLVEKKWRERR